MQGLIIKSFGRQFIVEVNGITYQCVTKSKNTKYVVGDLVIVDLINNQQAQIIDLIPRKNLIYRSEKNRSKIIASNINLILIIIAIKPNFNMDFLNGCLICAESLNIKPLIIINKTDLIETNRFKESIINLYQKQLGYKVITLSAINNCQTLKPILKNHTSLLIGQSGVGKSTIINKIIPTAHTKTGEINKAQTSGTHTTTSATLYHLDSDSQVIDCPGLQEFGLYHLAIENLIEYFPELIKLKGKCRFRNCSHINDLGCAIVEGEKKGIIDHSRLIYLQNLIITLQSKKNY